MSLLITKNDFKELVCKFKGHYASPVNIEKVISDPELELDTACERCHFGIQIKSDSEDSNFYIVTEID